MVPKPQEPHCTDLQNIYLQYIFFFHRIHPPCGAMTDEEAKNDHIKQHWEQTYVKNLKYAAERLEKVGLDPLHSNKFN